jgi:hypothetical protein
LHCIALHCIALHCIALHCIALHCIASHRIASHPIASHRIAASGGRGGRHLDVQAKVRDEGRGEGRNAQVCECRKGQDPWKYAEDYAWFAGVIAAASLLVRSYGHIPCSATAH